MSTTFVFSLILIIFLNLGCPAVPAKAETKSNRSGIVSRIALNDNDTLLEFFHNCNCTPSYRCEEVNRLIQMADGNSLAVQCSDPYYLCCKDPPKTPDSSEESTTPSAPEESTTPSAPISTTTSLPTIRLPTYNTSKCGIPKTNINVRILTPDVESATTIPGEIPWIVEIFQKTKNPQRPYKIKCAGTLIHEKVVLTAAHCVASAAAKSLRIVATGSESFQNIGVNPNDERNVVKKIRHPGFYSGGLYNDIALLILEEEYSYSNSFLNSICIPKTNLNFTGRKCVAAGWGENKDLESIPLKKVDVPIVESQRCQELLRKTEQGPDFKLHSSFLCAGGEEGKDTCKGDGGSPLICLGSEYKYVQIGIVSWGVGCGIVDQPGLYTDVIKLRDWINEELTKNKIKIK